jgi:hypothetical protein
MRKLTPAQRRAQKLGSVMSEEVGVMPMVPAQPKPKKPGQPAPGGTADPSTQMPETDDDYAVNYGGAEQGAALGAPDQAQPVPEQDMEPPIGAPPMSDPYAKHADPLATSETEANPELSMKVERIGAGLRKIVKASLELENAMAILKSERSDYSRGKALIDIRQELSNIVMQIKTELINFADAEPALANKVRDIIDNI